MIGVALAALAETAYADEAALSLSGDLSNGFLTSPVGLVSVQTMFSEPNFAIAPGDTYQSALLGQSVASAAFLTLSTGRVTTFTYDGLSSTHGTMVGSGATVAMTEATFVLSPTVIRHVVDMYTTNGSSLWISGLNIGANPVIQGRHDVGGGAFTNGLLWQNSPNNDIVSVSIFHALFIDGGVVATSGALTNLRTLPEMGTAVVWNGVVGTGVDEAQMIFDVTIPTPGSAALLGVCGLVATRRRR